MNEAPPLTFAMRLKIAREHADMTIHDMARALGVGRNTVPRWEAGTHVPPLGMVKQWAAETGVSLAYLLGEEEVENVPAQLERRRNPEWRQRRGGSQVTTTVALTELPAEGHSAGKQARKEAVELFHLVAAA